MTDKIASLAEGLERIADELVDLMKRDHSRSEEVNRHMLLALGELARAIRDHEPATQPAA